MARKNKNATQTDTATSNTATVPPSDSSQGVGAGKPTRAEIEKFVGTVNAALASRQELITRLTDRRRDVNAECGYPTGTIGVEHYQTMYDRNPVAARCVEVWAEECHKVAFSVYETEDEKTTTPFEEAVADLPRQLRGEESYFAQEQGSVIQSYVKRWQTVSGIGSYGVLLIGTDDGSKLDTPATFSPGPTAGRELTFLRVFPESLAPITQYEEDETSPRFGYPVMYSVTFNDPNAERGGIGVSTVTRDVHWTRVIHLPVNPLWNEVNGQPLLQQTFNRLEDCEKVMAGSGEMYWRGAFPGLSVESHPNLGAEIPLDLSALKDQMESYMNGLQRYLGSVGFGVKSLAPQVVKPNDHLDAMLTVIALRYGMPKRKLMGSERGELASSEDEGDWNDKISGIQNGFLTPFAIVPLFNRLINLGVLPVPPDGFSVYWPPLDAMGKKDKADIALKLTQALVAFIGGNGEAGMPLRMFLVSILGLSSEEAEEAVEEAEKIVAEQEAEAEAVRKEELRVKAEAAKAAAQNPAPNGKGQPPVPVGRNGRQVPNTVTTGD